MSYPSKVTHVYLIDDDEQVRKGLTRLLISAGYAVDSFPSAEEFLKTSITQPGCILLDVCMTGMTGLDLQNELKSKGLALPIVFLTWNGDVSMSVTAMKRGAINFLTKPVDDEVLIEAIQEGLDYLQQTHEDQDKIAFVKSCASSLTEREYEIMRYVISGALNKQVAMQLSISEKTVKVHRGRVMEKMYVDSVAELVRMCEAAGIEPIRI